jgi:hypothetical protein
MRALRESIPAVRAFGQGRITAHAREPTCQAIPANDEKSKNNNQIQRNSAGFFVFFDPLL